MAKSNEELISELVPAFQPKAREVLQRAKDELGYDFRITEGYRTPEKQNEYYSWGRTKINPNTNTWTIVTYVRGDDPRAYHVQRRAFDVYERTRGYNIDWNKYGAIVKSLGLVWGGDFPKLVDRPHAEYHGPAELTLSSVAATQPELTFATRGDFNETAYKYIFIAYHTAWPTEADMAAYRELAGQGLEPYTVAQRLFIEQLKQPVERYEQITDIIYRKIT